MEKVASDNAEDNCQLEFNYSCLKKTANLMIPVVLEDQLLDTKLW